MEWTTTITNPSKHKAVDDRWIEPSLPDFQLIQSIAREAGYSIAIHGSLKRDVDLIAVPWTEEAATWKTLVINLIYGLNARLVGEIVDKPHGRLACVIQINGYYKPIDLSIITKG